MVTLVEPKTQCTDTVKMWERIKNSRVVRVITDPLKIIRCSAKARVIIKRFLKFNIEDMPGADVLTVCKRDYTEGIKSLLVTGFVKKNFFCLYDKYKDKVLVSIIAITLPSGLFLCYYQLFETAAMKIKQKNHEAEKKRLLELNRNRFKEKPCPAESIGLYGLYDVCRFPGGVVVVTA
jgi:hypothetical protein